MQWRTSPLLSLATSCCYIRLWQYKLILVPAPRVPWWRHTPDQRYESRHHHLHITSNILRSPPFVIVWGWSSHVATISIWTSDMIHPRNLHECIWIARGCNLKVRKQRTQGDWASLTFTLCIPTQSKYNSKESRMVSSNERRWCCPRGQKTNRRIRIIPMH